MLTEILFCFNPVKWFASHREINPLLISSLDTANLKIVLTLATFPPSPSRLAEKCAEYTHVESAERVHTMYMETLLSGIYFNLILF